MSQFPYGQSPYQPPIAGYASWPVMTHDPLHPARVTGWLQIGFGAILVLFGTCAGIIGLIPASQFRDAQVPNLPPGITLEQALYAALITGACSFVLGMLLIVLAVFVRRGHRGAVVASLALLGVVALIMLMQFLGSLIAIASNPLALIAVMLYGAALVPCAIIFARLIAILRSPYDLQAMHMQQAQYWAMMQQQGSVGYGYPPAPPTGAGPVGQPPPPAPEGNDPPAPTG